MEKHFVLTDEIMKNAVSYMPIEDKADMANVIAKKCVVDIPTAQQNLDGEKFLALPYIKGEDRELKAMCVMNVLLEYYLKIKVEKPFTEDHYNFYASGSILNQIERYKSNFDLKNKAFDLLADYKEFRKFVDNEIANLIAVNNDPLARFMASISVLSNPENIKKAVEELKIVSDKYAKELKEKKILSENKTENN